MVIYYSFQDDQYYTVVGLINIVMFQGKVNLKKIAGNKKIFYEWKIYTSTRNFSDMLFIHFMLLVWNAPSLDFCAPICWNIYMENSMWMQFLI